MNSKELYVICFYWQGDRWCQNRTERKNLDLSYLRHLKRVGCVSRQLSVRYINNLYEGVKKWSVHPFKFVCFTNDKLELNKEIECRPIQFITDKGVLPRMYMFSEQAGLFGHQVLCLDIDVVIVGPLRDLMNYDGLFCTRSSWARGEEHLIDGDIMSFKGGRETQNIFWEPFVNNIKKVEDRTKGRERIWIRDAIQDKADTWQKLIPKQVCSYKRHVRNGELPQHARIVSCHGYPRPHQINEQWRINNWS